MSDEERQSDGRDETDKPHDGKAAFWYAVIEFFGWILEATFWIVRAVVAGVAALLHSCS